MDKSIPMKHHLVTLFFLFFTAGYCQSGELLFLRGKIVCSIPKLSNVNVYNLRSDSNTTTNENGDYSLFAMAGDTLKFTSIQIETKKIVITQADLAKSIFVTSLSPNVINLNEVQIKEYKNINSVSLRILDKPAKQYTPAERKLYTATTGLLDPLLNTISGRKAMLKKELAVEKKEKLLKKIEYQFGVDYFTKRLKISAESVKGFWYYAIDDPRLEEAINVKNKTKAAFIFAELATKYKELQKTALN